MRSESFEEAHSPVAHIQLQIMEVIRALTPGYPQLNKALLV